VDNLSRVNTNIDVNYKWLSLEIHHYKILRIRNVAARSTAKIILTDKSDSTDQYK